MRKFFKNNILTIIIVVATFGGIILFSVLPKPSLALSSGIVAIISAITGVLLTVLVTKSLLDKQSENEKDKDKSAKIFEEKLVIYKDFLSKLHGLVKDGKISDDNVKELIFQISYVAMHTSSDRVIDILKQLKDTINEVGTNNYGQLAQNLLDVVLVLQEELYGKKLGKKINDDVFEIFDNLVTNIEKVTGEEIQTLLETVEIDKIEVQTYFWKELVKQLKNINPKYSDNSVTEEKIEKDVKEYYARARNRHRYYGLTFEIYKSESQGRSVRFCVEIENDYYYGFYWGSEPQSDDRLSQIVKQVSSKYKSNQWWGGWRWPDYTDQDGRYHDLDFWKMKDNNAMRRLIDENQREKLIEDIAQEMNEQIRKFVEIAKKNNL